MGHRSSSNTALPSLLKHTSNNSRDCAYFRLISNLAAQLISFYLNVLTPNNFWLASSQFFPSDTFLCQRRENCGKELGLNPGPLAMQAATLTSRLSPAQAAMGGFFENCKIQLVFVVGTFATWVIPYGFGSFSGLRLRICLTTHCHLIFNFGWIFRVKSIRRLGK